MRLGRAAFMQANDLDYRRSVRQAVETFCNVAATDNPAGNHRTLRNLKWIFMSENAFDPRRYRMIAEQREPTPE
jgi:hypothetical protein